MTTGYGTEPVKVLVVCTGNICRSPLAAALLQDRLLLGGVHAEVTSAGVAAPVGAPAERPVLRLATEFGADLSAHRARQATPSLLRTADLILGLTAEHADEIHHRAPGVPVTTLAAAARRARMLSSRVLHADTWLTRLTAWIEESPAYTPVLDDIADPYGGSRRIYRRMADDVDTATAALARHWSGR